jgi:hypothetical protein
MEQPSRDGGDGPQGVLGLVGGMAAAMKPAPYDSADARYLASRCGACEAAIDPPSYDGGDRGPVTTRGFQHALSQ